MKGARYRYLQKVYGASGDTNTVAEIHRLVADSGVDLDDVEDIRGLGDNEWFVVLIPHEDLSSQDSSPDAEIFLTTKRLCWNGYSSANAITGCTLHVDATFGISN